LEDRRSVGASSCNFGDGTDQTKGSILDVHDDDDCTDSPLSKILSDVCNDVKTLTAVVGTNSGVARDRHLLLSLRPTFCSGP